MTISNYKSPSEVQMEEILNCSVFLVHYEVIQKLFVRKPQICFYFHPKIKFKLIYSRSSSITAPRRRFASWSLPRRMAPPRSCSPAATATKRSSSTSWSAAQPTWSSPAPSLSTARPLREHLPCGAPPPPDTAPSSRC